MYEWVRIGGNGGKSMVEAEVEQKEAKGEEFTSQNGIARREKA
jgi:hypothetical protein